MTMEANEKLVQMHINKGVEAKSHALLTADVAMAFLEWTNRLRKEKMGGVLLYDVPAHYKFLGEKELFDYFINYVYKTH